MGRRGPLPDNDKTRIEKGLAPRHDLPTAAPVKTVPAPPKWLQPEAKKEWKRLAPVLVGMGALTEADVSAFEQLCQTYAFLRQTENALLETGGVLSMQKNPKNGCLTPHPLTTQRFKFHDEWRRALSDFGLTPASRGRLLVSEVLDQTASANDPMEILLSGGNLE